MKLTFFLLLACSFSFAQSAKQQKPDMNTIWAEELPALKQDTAQLRAMLNVMATQEGSADSRTSPALYTNRQMWQIVIARLAELTQRMDALERRAQEMDGNPNPATKQRAH